MTPEQEALVVDNLGLVHYVTRRHSRWMLAHMEYEDLYQVGAIGLIKAAKSYDRSRGKFSTLAARCIYMTQANEMRKLQKSKRQAPQSLIYLDAPIKDNGQPIGDLIAAPDQDAIDLRIDVQAVLDGLPERERRIVALRRQGVSQQKIAKRLGVTQPSISRTLINIVSVLRR